MSDHKLFRMQTEIADIAIGLEKTLPLWLPGGPAAGPCRVLFRARWNAGELPPRFGGIWVSASQRFRLWLDGVEMAQGPSRADRGQWGLVAVDLSHVREGEHLFAVEVVHWGPFAGKGQVGGPPFFFFAGLDLSWRCAPDAAWSPMTDPPRHRLSGHRAVGAGDRVEAARHPWGWKEPAFDDSNWAPAEPFGEPPGNPWGNYAFGCRLVPEPLPPMARVPHPWRQEPGPFSLAAASTGAWLFDAGLVLNALPTLLWTGGRGAKVRLTWCEAPVRPDGTKGNRDHTEGMLFPGQEDLLLPDGGAERRWTPDWFRSFRYLHVEVETGEQSLDDFRVTLERVGFPLDPVLSIQVEDPAKRDWPRLRQISLDTAAACAHETFFDCPAWEQAQFPGDARIQVRHHYLLAGDDRLALKAIRDLAASVTPSGLLRSHAPSSFEQIIATYSLQWIGMLQDHRAYRGDAEALRPFLPFARGILDYFLDRRRGDGLLGWIGEPLFFDWAKGFVAGCAPQERDGGSIPATALLAEACGWMAELERFAGRSALVPEWRAEATGLLDALRACPRGGGGLLPDTPAATSFSLHAQVQAALAGLWTPEEAGAILEHAMNAPGVIQPGTMYYRSHLAEALRRAVRGDLVWSLYPRWFALLEGTGLTTWPETDRASPRSDCHGWGVMPDIELVHTLLGVAPDPAPDGWARTLFTPCPGDLTALRATIPHPRGLIHVNIRRDGEGDVTEIDSPVPVVRGLNNWSD
ncbi:MAG: hypothetical protein LAT83_09895 [Kiritimatiellae bacterium]|nr:hypothetical protein [Kiritimatiellia bacterium]